MIVNIRNVQIFEVDSKKYFYKYTSNTLKTAYYKCLTSSCGGRAAANIKKANELGIETWTLDEELRVK